MKNKLREISVAVAFVALLLVLWRVKPDFFMWSNIRTLLVSMSPIIVAAVGMTLVIIARNIDISIGWQFSVCAVVASWLAAQGIPLPYVIGATLLTGGILGAVNGALIAGMNLPSIVVTLATMVIYRESLRWIRSGEAVRDASGTFQWFGLGQETGQWVIMGTALGVVIVFAIAMRYLAAGRAVYAAGSDQEAARLAGIRPRLVVFGVFATMGVLAGLAALLSAVRLASVYPNTGDGLELQVIAAVVVGGTAVSGGRGTICGTLIGAALLATIRPALTTLGVPPEWEKALQGAIILLAVASDSLRRRA